MKLAAFDVGSNTVLMLVVETAGHELKQIANFSRITRLGRGVDKSGKLDPDSAKRTLEAIVEFTARPVTWAWIKLPAWRPPRYATSRTAPPSSIRSRSAQASISR